MKKTLLIIAVLTAGSSSLFAQWTTSGSNVYRSTGKVGIGTTFPQKALHIHNNAAAHFLLSGLAPGILFSADQTNSIYRAAIGLATSNNHFISGTTAGDFAMRGQNGKDLVFGTMIGTSIAERMRIKNNGNVGIGTANPTAKLHVSGNILAEANINSTANITATGSIKNGRVKLGSTDGYVKLKHINDGGVFRTAIAPADPQIGELLINSGSENYNFANGTRVMGTKLIVDGNVGIGTTTPPLGYKLAVNGKVICEELKIRTYANWPDYVFEDSYQLKSLAALETEINSLGHLPNMPSATTVEKEGYNVSEVNAKLLEKVEELTLYTIAQQKEIEQLKEAMKTLLKDQ